MVESTHNGSRSKRLRHKHQLFINKRFQMSYISHVDYKKMMEGFKKGAPKGLLKEELEQEGNAFTAGLAKAKKGQEFKVGDKSVKDTSNYDASVNEYQFDDMYQDDPGPFEGEVEESHLANDQWHEDFQAAILAMGLAGEAEARVMKALDHTDPMIQYGNMPAAFAAAEFVNDLGIVDADDYDDYDADYEEPRDDFDMAGDFNDGEFWENEVKKLQEIAGVKSHDDGPEDDDTEEREARAKKMEDDDTEAENTERDIDEEEKVHTGKYDWVTSDGSHMRDPEKAAKVVADKHAAELKPALATYKKAKESDDNKALVAAWKDYKNKAISWAGHEMLESGMRSVVVRNLLSGHDYYEDWNDEYLTALDQELKRGMEEGLHMPPLQATGPTVDVNEDQAPFGMSVLSPDERKQLKEYINSYKTIKSEIAKLLEKSGRSGKIMEGAADDEAVPAARKAVYRDPTTVPTQHKHSNLGGNRTGLVMTKAEMWEGEEEEGGEHERIEGMLNTKLHDAFHKVTGMIMKDLMDDGFDEGDIKNFLQHEIDEKAKEYALSQYDPH